MCRSKRILSKYISNYCESLQRLLRTYGDSCETESDAEEQLLDQTTSKLSNDSQWYVFIRNCSIPSFDFLSLIADH